MFFVLHNYYDKNIIFFVSVGLKQKVFAILQLSSTDCNYPVRFFTKCVTQCGPK